MKLILTQEVAGLGSPGDVVEVRDGYARNYLVPRGYAMPWTRGGEKQVATIRRARDARQVRDLGHAREIKSELERLSVRLPARAGQGGRLFGSVTAADVVSAVQAAGGPQLDRRRLQLSGGIKSLGRHDVPVVLHPEVTATIPVEVVKA
ncbi:MAG TPA: 50S ribosomal protein L9 [Mycobacteriales bacterium]|nr:50S ribosomal protein L9 [Mycobacteriales bacterium]